MDSVADLRISAALRRSRRVHLAVLAVCWSWFLLGVITLVASALVWGNDGPRSLLGIVLTVVVMGAIIGLAYGRLTFGSAYDPFTWSALRIGQICASRRKARTSVLVELGYHLTGWGLGRYVLRLGFADGTHAFVKIPWRVARHMELAQPGELVGSRRLGAKSLVIANGFAVWPLSPLLPKDQNFISRRSLPVRLWDREASASRRGLLREDDAWALTGLTSQRQSDG